MSAFWNRRGWSRRQKVGRVRTCKLGPSRLMEEAAWIETYRQLWTARFDALDTVVEELKQKEKDDGRRDASGLLSHNRTHSD